MNVNDRVLPSGNYLWFFPKITFQFIGERDKTWNHLPVFHAACRNLRMNWAASIGGRHGRISQWKLSAKGTNSDITG